MGLRPALLLVAAIVMAGGAYAYALPARSPEPAGFDAAAAKRHALRVSASVPELLYPGVRREVRVRILNRNRRAVTVESLTVGVTRAPSGCSARSLRIGRFRGPRLVIPARQARTAGLSARLARHAADACQRARFGLRADVRARSGG